MVMLWLLMGLAFGDIYPKVGRDSHFSFEGGDGSTIVFWNDRWCGEVPLKELFLGLMFSRWMEILPLVIIRSKCLVVIFGTCFCLNGFIDDDTLISFLNKLDEANLGDYSLDKVRQDPNTKGDVTIRSFYLTLLRLNYSSLRAHFERGFLGSSYGSLWPR